MQGGELGRRKGNFGGGRVELTKELNWEKNRTEPKIEVQRIEETPPRVEGRLSKGSCCAEKEALSAFSSLYPLNSTHWDNSWRESIRIMVSTNWTLQHFTILNNTKPGWRVLEY